METIGSLSPAMAADAIELLLDEFERSLIAMAMAVKIQPYGIYFTQTAILTVMDCGSMRGDPRTDDGYIEKQLEEPEPAAIDSYVPNGGEVK